MVPPSLNLDYLKLDLSSDWTDTETKLYFRVYTLLSIGSRRNVYLPYTLARPMITLRFRIVFAIGILPWFCVISPTYWRLEPRLGANKLALVIDDDKIILAGFLGGGGT